MAKARNYKEEYRKYHSSAKARADRTKRVLARRKLERELGKTALKGKDVDHKRPLSKGGTNARSNLRVLSIAKNRGRK